MRNSLLLLLLGLYACTGNNEKNLIGTWIEQMPQGMNYIQGFHLKDNGTAESVGMRTLLYNKWEIKDNKLILSGESVGNGQTIQFSDTMNIIRCHADTLVVNRKNMDVVYVRQNNDLETIKSRPSRAAHEGFTWKELSGAGLTLWVQENKDIRLIADPSLPGIVMVRNGCARPQMLIRVFDLPNHDINDVIRTLEKADNWDSKQTGRFEEVKPVRDGVRRFVMVPYGNYGAEVRMLMKSEPVPAPCNGWGVGNSGTRYFEIHDSHPDKAIFVETGQEAPLFDEGSIVFSDTDTAKANGEMSTDELFTLKGTVTIGHEVRAFKPEGSNDEYWIVDKTGSLEDLYDKTTKGQKNGSPVKAVLKLEYNGKWDDGFAAEYSGVFFVREIVSLNK